MIFWLFRFCFSTLFIPGFCINGETLSEGILACTIMHDGFSLALLSISWYRLAYIYTSSINLVIGYSAQFFGYSGSLMVCDAHAQLRLWTLYSLGVIAYIHTYIHNILETLCKLRECVYYHCQFVRSSEAGLHGCSRRLDLSYSCIYIIIYGCLCQTKSRSYLGRSCSFDRNASKGPWRSEIQYKYVQRANSSFAAAHIYAFMFNSTSF